MQEWSYLDQTHETETVGFLACEAGAWKLTDGNWFEAGKTYATDEWTTVSLKNDFELPPVVFS